MKLIYIANARMPTEKAHGYQIAKMCEGFALLGIDVELVVPRRFNWLKKDLFEYYEIKKNFKVRRLPCLDLIPLDKYIGIFGFWIEVVSFLFFCWCYLLFKRADIFYTRDKALLSLTLLKNNIVYEAHSFPHKYFLYKRFLKRTRAIVVVTQGLKDLFVKHKAGDTEKKTIWGVGYKGVERRDKILVAHDSVDLSVFDINLSKQSAREKLCLPMGRKIIGYFGRFQTMGKAKGIDTVFDALKMLEKDIVFLAVGEKPEVIAEYKDKAGRTGIGERVIFIERAPRQKVAEYQKACDALLMPFPYSEHYAKFISPFKTFEYMASKRPIVASDLPSLREILNEKNAVLTAPGNAAALARGIKKTVGDKVFSQSIAEKAHKDAGNHTWEKRVKKIVRFAF